MIDALIDIKYVVASKAFNLLGQHIWQKKQNATMNSDLVTCVYIYIYMHARMWKAPKEALEEARCVMTGCVFPLEHE